MDYAYKKRFSGVYEDRKQRGLLKKYDSNEKFLDPTSLGINNTLQRALQTEMAEKRKHEEHGKKNDDLVLAAAQQ